MATDTRQRSSDFFLSVEGVSYQIFNKTVLSDISFEIKTGERVAVFGPSGAGKSTLIRLLNRLNEPTAGVIRVEGQDYTGIPPRVLRRRLGMVMQNPYLFPGSVADNLNYGPRVHGKTLDKQQISRLLKGVDLGGYEDRDVSTLSGGEAQRVNLARTLANQPDMLLLDEPTSSLDQAARKEVEETIFSVLRTQRVTCLLVTHEREQVMRMAERVLLLEGGQLAADGPVSEVMDARAVD